MRTESGYTVSVLCAATGANPNSVRAWRLRHVVPPFRGGANGRPRYTFDDLVWYAVLTELNRWGVDGPKARAYADAALRSPGGVCAGGGTVTLLVNVGAIRTHVVERLRALGHPVPTLDGIVDAVQSDG
jgi:hypothetical protein